MFSSLHASDFFCAMQLTVRPGGPSILITTHYIEEARQADIVGMMRDGALLAEDHPAKLMRQ
jgi:ABC-2 type transport system ATP-binding protein